MQQTKREKKNKRDINETKQTKYMEGNSINTKRYENGDNTHTVQRLQAYHHSITANATEDHSCHAASNSMKL